MRSGYWQDRTTVELSTLDPERVIAVLPVAAVEQHGPHLPLGTDRVIVDGLVARALALLPDGCTALALPTCAVGDSLEHTAFPGTLSLRAETLIESWRQIGAHVARSGVRKLAIVNSHGGQPQVVDIVAARLRAEERMLVARVNSFALGAPVGLFTPEERTYGYHGGALETALMLHLAPDLVRRDAIAAFPSGAQRIAETSTRLGAEGEPDGRAGIGWMIQDLNSDGACGDARGANAEAGKALLDHMAERLAEIIADMTRFPLADLKDGPLSPS